MKKIEAIIQPGRFEAVRIALEQVGYPGVTLTEVKGHGKQKGVTRSFFGREIRTSILPKLKLEIVAPDDQVGKILKAILESARTDQTGDGKVFIHSVEKAYKISSEEEDDAVVS